MEQVYFFSGQQVEADDLNAISDKLGDQMKARTVDYFSKGVVSDASGTFVFKDINNTIQVQPLIAYTNEGERINVYKTIRGLALNLSKPTERRLTQQGTLAPEDFGWELGVEYDIYVSYITKPARPRAHNVTGDFYPTRLLSGFEFYAIRVGVDPITNTEGKTPMVRLCHLVYDGTDLQITSAGYIEISTIDSGKIYTNTDSVTPTSYNPNSQVVSMEDHVMCMGSGTPSPSNPHGLTAADIGINMQDVGTHEKNMHAPGLLAKRSSTNSAFYTMLDSISTKTDIDMLVIYNLTTGERLHHNGTWVDSYAYQGTYVYLIFSEDTSTINAIPDGKYRIGFNIESRKFVIGTDATYKGVIRVCSDSRGRQVQDNITAISMDAYNAGDFYSLSEFDFVGTKAESTIISSFATGDGTSNFTSKEDLRVFGSLSSNELQTTKGVVDGQWKDLFYLPYEVRVSSLSLWDGVNATPILGDTSLPFGYIRGYQISYNSSNAITIFPGRCRDNTNTNDIVLTQAITKYVDTQWTLGGVGTPVGGLQNDESRTCSLTETDYGGPLHVFAIMNVSGIVDIALDTDINGENINKSTTCPTYSYKFKRRVGSIYLSHRAQAVNGANVELIRPFTSFSDSNALYIQYNEAPILEYVASVAEGGSDADDAKHLNMYDIDTATFIHTYVPPDYPFKAKFAYNMHTTDLAVKVDDPDHPGSQITYTMHQTNTGSILLPTAINTIQYLHGAGQFDVYMEQGTLPTNGQWDFENTLQCLGYYDSRDIL